MSYRIIENTIVYILSNHKDMDSLVIPVLKLLLIIKDVNENIDNLFIKMDCCGANYISISHGKCFVTSTHAKYLL